MTQLHELADRVERLLLRHEELKRTNALLQQDRAIVTPIAGTTRDVVSESAAIEGIPVRLLDTAGIREGQDVVETLGIERSYRAMADADLTIVVLDAARIARALEMESRAALDAQAAAQRALPGARPRRGRSPRTS